MSRPDVLVIGSGPAGVSVAFPLVARGRSVLMLEAGRAEAPRLSDGPARRLGDRLEALRVEDGLSPKLRTPVARRLADDFARASGTLGDDFVAVGGLGAGGLSQVWGAFACELTDDDLGGWPIDTAELAESYRAVSRRIGISGRLDEDFAADCGRHSDVMPPPPLGGNAAAMLARYRRLRERRPSALPGLSLGHARNALLTEDRNGRLACDGNGGCLWGCPRQSIYDARSDLAALRRQPGFSLADDAYVLRLERTGDGYRVSCADGRRFEAGRVVLAAGVLETTRLAAGLLQQVPADWRLESSPTMAMPLFVPGGLGRRLVATHSLAQLGYRLALDDAPDDPAFGAVYETEALPASAFVPHIPLGRRAATALFDALSPALIVATSYLSGRHSNNRIVVSRDGDRPRLTVAARLPQQTLARFEAVRGALSRRFRALGAHALPGAAVAQPGIEAHYGATLPMGAAREAGTTRWGEVNGQPGLHVADGACLTAVPARHTTFTIMANADRIGRHLAALP